MSVRSFLELNHDLAPDQNNLSDWANKMYMYGASGNKELLPLGVKLIDKVHHTNDKVDELYHLRKKIEEYEKTLLWYADFQQKGNDLHIIDQWKVKITNIHELGKKARQVLTKNGYEEPYKGTLEGLVG